MAIRSVRFADAADVAAAWDELRNSDSQKDRVIVRKGDALDFVAGVIGDIRQKRRSSWSWEARKRRRRDRPGIRPGLWPRKLAAGGSRRGCAAQERRTCRGPERRVLRWKTCVDFRRRRDGERAGGPGGGRRPRPRKIRSLADLPRQVDYKRLNPFWSADDQTRIQSLRIDQVPWGRTGNSSLRTGGKAYSKGLWIHSGTTIRIPLDRQYRKLQALAGLDENPAGRPKVQPKVRVIISLDGKPAVDQTLGWDQAPVSLDIDTADVRLLEIEVQSAGEPGFFGACEHLDLVEAKLIK